MKKEVKPVKAQEWIVMFNGEIRRSETLLLEESEPKEQNNQKL